ncbi:MAG TPA: YsnF/AvaK domain-containing protein [Noviherbaspirillum sp.]
MAHSKEHDNASPQHDELVGAAVTDASGNKAAVVSTRQHGTEANAWVKLEDGTQVLVPVSLFGKQADGTYRLPFTFHISDEARSPVQMSFPVMEEELHVSKRVVDTGRGVRVHKTVSERDELIEQTLMRDELTVEHVPVGRVVDEGSLPQTRYEGDTLVVPVLEEVLVVQKQTLLKEEVRITRRRHPERAPQSVVLRTEHVSVERFDEGRKQ